MRTARDTRVCCEKLATRCLILQQSVLYFILFFFKHWASNEPIKLKDFVIVMINDEILTARAT